MSECSCVDTCGAPDYDGCRLKNIPTTLTSNDIKDLKKSLAQIAQTLSRIEGQLASLRSQNQRYGKAPERPQPQKPSTSLFP